jgi:hypothetical protein
VPNYKRHKEATIFSYTLLINKEGKLETEITSLPIEDEEVMIKCFKIREERNFYINLVSEARRKLKPIHEWLKKYLNSIT